MTAVLLLACERDGGAWPPLAVVCRELSLQNLDVSALCDDSIGYAFESAHVLNIPTEFHSMSYIDHAVATRIAPRIEQGASWESVESPLDIWAEALAPAIRAQVEALRPNILVASMFCLPMAITLARELSVPVVSINPGLYLGPSPPRALEDDYPGLALWWFKKCALPPILQSDSVLHATDQQFDLNYQRLPESHHYVGPLIWSPPGEAPPEMEEQRDPWITASVSLIRQPGEMDLLATIVEAAEGLPANVLLTAPDHDVSELRAVPPNVLLRQFISHAAALERSQLMLSHAGHGAVMRALWTGVPMVLTPWDRDQSAVAHRAGKLGVARVIHRADLNAEVLHRVLREALVDGELQAASRNHHERLQRTDPPALAAELITQLARQAR